MSPLRNPIGEKKNRLSGEPTHEDVNPHLVPNLANKEGVPVVARPIQITRIAPDRAQPRHVIPAVARGSWDGNPADLPAVLEVWRAHVANALNIRVFEPRPYLLADENAADLAAGGKLPPLVTGYLSLLQLAANIHDHGLINPITAYRSGDMHIVVTGERRLLAHHILALHVDREIYSRIPAQVVSQPDVWQQASENTAREELNAVGRARQLAILLMDLHKDTMTFESYAAVIARGGTDLDYYQQGDLDAKHGTSARIQQAMGVKTRGSLTQYRKLLRLPADIWAWGDANDNTLRDLLVHVDEEDGTNYSGKNPQQDTQSVYQINTLPPAPPQTVNQINSLPPAAPPPQTVYPVNTLPPAPTPPPPPPTPPGALYPPPRRDNDHSTPRQTDPDARDKRTAAQLAAAAVIAPVESTYPILEDDDGGVIAMFLAIDSIAAASKIINSDHINLIRWWSTSCRWSRHDIYNAINHQGTNADEALAEAQQFMILVDEMLENYRQSIVDHISTIIIEYQRIESEMKR